jgi:hypothetical protein
VMGGAFCFFDVFPQRHPFCPMTGIEHPLLMADKYMLKRSLAMRLEVLEQRFCHFRTLNLLVHYQAVWHLANMVEFHPEDVSHISSRQFKCTFAICSFISITWISRMRWMANDLVQHEVKCLIIFPEHQGSNVNGSRCVEIGWQCLTEWTLRLVGICSLLFARWKDSCSPVAVANKPHGCRESSAGVLSVFVTIWSIWLSGEQCRANIYRQWGKVYHTWMIGQPFWTQLQGERFPQELSRLNTFK